MSAAARPDISEVRKAWKEANLAPLWENAKAHRPAPPPDAAYLWSWDKIRPLISAAIAVASPEVVERRVLQLVPPIAEHRDEQQTSRTLSANIQILLPGEKARAHRHTMNALRFVLEGSGATTVVDGKACAMEEGDLILTPAWTWHEHIHEARCAGRAVPALYGDGRV
jgi:gentisate 1,2-dioxygenase